MHVSWQLFVVALALNITCAAAKPISNQNEVPCDNIEKYTTEWFLKHTKPKFAGPIQDTALFYTRGMSKDARRHARLSRRRLTTIWDVWPCPLYNHHQTPSNPLRCIHHDKAWQLAYFGNMSRAFAMKAKTSATVLHSKADFDTPPTDGIWGKIELPKLIEGEQVDKLEKRKLFWNFKGLSEVFWERARELRDPLPEMSQKILSKRGDESDIGGYCMMEDDYDLFDRINW